VQVKSQSPNHVKSVILWLCGDLIFQLLASGRSYTLPLPLSSFQLSVFYCLIGDRPLTQGLYLIS